ncbi:MAG: DUF4384 domain-containing protein [Deltaproteobacteria bacterium]|nr:DUF4384 domain-containing protein [Deltaproteobacteria bacterium]
MKNTIIITCTIILLSGSGFWCSSTEAQEQEVSPLYDNVMEKLENLTPGDTMGVLVGTEKEQYDFGSELEIRFMASKDCYITLMSISNELDTSNKYVPGGIVFFIPGKGFSNKKIEAERVYSTTEDLDLTIVVAPPDGLETINLFCSPEKIKLFEANLEEGLYIIQPHDEKRLQALSDRLDQLSQYEWAGNSTSILLGKAPKISTGTTRGTSKIWKGDFAQPNASKFFPPIETTGTGGKFFPPIETTGTGGKK